MGRRILLVRINYSCFIRCLIIWWANDKGCHRRHCNPDNSCCLQREEVAAHGTYNHKVVWYCELFLIVQNYFKRHPGHVNVIGMAVWNGGILFLDLNQSSLQLYGLHCRQDTCLKRPYEFKRKLHLTICRNMDNTRHLILTRSKHIIMAQAKSHLVSTHRASSTINHKDKLDSWMW